MTGRPAGSTIHHAEARDRLLEAVARGELIDEAAISIGTSGKTVQRFAAANPGWAAQLKRARRGEDYQREVEPEIPRDRTLAPVEPTTVVDGVPVERASIGPAGADSFGSVSRAEYDGTMAGVFRDPEHPQWHRVMKVYAALFDGPEIIRARRRAEGEPLPLQVGEKPQRILVIRVPDNGTRGAGR
jgi:hypothetical protein